MKWGHEHLEPIILGAAFAIILILFVYEIAYMPHIVAWIKGILG